jgi:hypothetical protein
MMELKITEKSTGKTQIFDFKLNNLSFEIDDYFVEMQPSFKKIEREKDNFELTLRPERNFIFRIRISTHDVEVLKDKVIKIVKDMKQSGLKEKRLIFDTSQELLDFGRSK